MNKAYTFENLLEMWNEEFPSNPLTAVDLKIPQAMFNALFLVLKRLDIDKETVYRPPPEEERNDHTAYYWDLIPVINITRVLNHILIRPQEMNAQVNISHFLQPMTQTSFPILMLIFNYMLFIEQRLKVIEPFEEGIMANNQEIKSLEDCKNEKIQLLNNHAVEKGKMVQKTQMMEEEIIILDEEQRHERAARDEENMQREPILQENHKAQKIVEHMTSQRDTLVGDIEKLKALRVYDADDIKEQESKLAQEMAEAEQKCNTLSATLMQKESRLINLQAIKQSFDGANECLQTILTIVDSLKESEKSDFDADSEEGELKMLNTELTELQSQHAELMLAREEGRKKRQDATARRHQAKTSAERTIYELKENDKKQKEKTRKELQIIDEINKRLLEYEHLQNVYPQQYADIKEDFIKQIQMLDEQVMQELKKSGEKIKQKLYENRR